MPRLDVNYGGSSGYGRAYMYVFTLSHRTSALTLYVHHRNRLNSFWGIVDVRDCALSVSILAEKHGLIDPKRTAIRGGSSGGFTVLATLCAYPDVFGAGGSLYGISDLQKLDEFTHKFESRYCEKLLGGTYAQVPQVYKERSPVNNADKIKSPLLVSAHLMMHPATADLWSLAGSSRFNRRGRTAGAS